MIVRVSEKVRRFYRRQPPLSEGEAAGRLKPYEQGSRRTLVFAGVMRKRAGAASTGQPEPTGKVSSRWP